MRRIVKWVVGWTTVVILLALALAAAPPAARAEWGDASFGRAAMHFVAGLGEDVGDGLGVSLDLDAYVSEHFGLRGTVGYFQLEALRSQTRSGQPYASDLDAIHLGFGPILRYPGRIFSPFVTAGPGLYLTNYSGLFEFSVGGGGRLHAALDGGAINLGLRAGAGVDVYLGQGFGLGAELSYTNVLSHGRNLELVGVHLGLDYHFH
jgi:hypothetical protein